MGQPYNDAYSRQYYRQYVHISRYRLSQHKTELPSVLLDRGANGCMVGADMWLLETTQHYVDITGFEGHKVNNLPIATHGCNMAP